jgi:hypothetical protein
MPVEDFLPTREQKDRLGRAQIALIRACMARFGIAYEVTPEPPGQYGPVSLTDRRYGISDMDLARMYGYGLGPRDPALAPRPNRPQLGADGETVLTGQGRSIVSGIAVPAGGCIGEAERALTPPANAGADILRGSKLQFESFAQSRGDSRVRAAVDAWSACMAKAGFHYADPLAAAADPAFISTLDQHQLTVAATDIGCKSSTNVIGIWFTVESAYQQRAIDADRPGFVATRAAIEARDRLASAAGQ